MRKITLLCLALLIVGFAPAGQQSGVPIITFTVEAGFDGYFRSDSWFPLQIDIRNDGDSTTGRLVLRPERAGDAFPNTFSVAVDMPSGSRKSVMLYATARSYATQAVVEFIDDGGFVGATESAALRHVPLEDHLHLVLTQSAVGSVDLTAVASGGYQAFQANWLIDNLPQHAAVLDAVDSIVFSDIDTSLMTSDQRQAIADWVYAGGHLLVTGGSNWQATAAGLEDLLPATATGSETTDDLDSLAAMGDGTALDGDTLITTLELHDDARSLAQTEDGRVLLARHHQGMGSVDYLALDPMSQPMRSWSGQQDLWLSLTTSLDPQPGWSQRRINFEGALLATEILPGLNLLPDVLPLCGFLAVYIALLGPLNYAILNRLNRREYAWLSIPALIVIFSALAWFAGFNLRGNEVTLSRLAVVQSWPESEIAQVDGLVGILSPRRSNYTLTMPGDTIVRPLASSRPNNIFAANVQARTDIQQEDSFVADNFSVDASFMATFWSSSLIDRPAIGGQATLFYERIDPEEQHWALRGSVRNDSEYPLNEPVILARGGVYALDTALEPGDVQTFELSLEDTQPPAPGLLEHGTQTLGLNIRRTRDVISFLQTTQDIIGAGYFDAWGLNRTVAGSPEEQEVRRRQELIAALAQDQYQATARGNRVFLAGWSDEMPLQTELEGAGWEPLDTTLHLVELSVETDRPLGRVRVTPDQFTWVALERPPLATDIVPVNGALGGEDVAVFRYTPLAESRLSDVESLIITLDSRNVSTETFPLELWNWETQDWNLVELPRVQESLARLHAQRIINPAPYIGPMNAVQLRLFADPSNNFMTLVRLSVEQEGRF